MKPKFYVGLFGPHSLAHKNLHAIEAVEVLHDCIHAIRRDPFDDKEPSFEMNGPLLGQLALSAAAQMCYNTVWTPTLCKLSKLYYE
jgi:hypothetical protein